MIQPTDSIGIVGAPGSKTHYEIVYNLEDSFELMKAVQDSFASSLRLETLKWSKLISRKFLRFSCSGCVIFAIQPSDVLIQYENRRARPTPGYRWFESWSSDSVCSVPVQHDHDFFFKSTYLHLRRKLHYPIQCGNYENLLTLI